MRRVGRRKLHLTSSIISVRYAQNLLLIEIGALYYIPKCVAICIGLKPLYLDSIIILDFNCCNIEIVKCSGYTNIHVQFNEEEY